METARIQTILDRMPPIDIEEMRNIHLMDRLDFKYVVSASLLPRLLEEMIPHFKVQVNKGMQVAPYTTQYLDTSSLDMFLMHQNGKRNRQKIRIRTYIIPQISYLEVKNKNNKGRTLKTRVPIPFSHITSIDELGESLSFLQENSRFTSRSLTPVLANEFSRLTFVNNRLTERITIDFGISFHNYKTGENKALENLIVLELKQDGWQHSDFRDILFRMRVRNLSFSKYCMGTMLTNRSVKSNRLKGRLRMINKYTLNNQ